MTTTRERKVRGVFEKFTGIRNLVDLLFDATGRKRREKVGRKSDSIDLYQKRKLRCCNGGSSRKNFAQRRLVMNGVDLRTVQELMDTRLFSMTYRYAHLAASHKLAARAIGCSGRSK